MVAQNVQIQIESISFEFSKGTRVSFEFGKYNGLILLRRGIDEFAVIRRELLGSNILQRIKVSSVIFKCITDDVILRLVDERTRYVVIPVNIRESDAPPRKFFKGLKRISTLSIRDVCKVDGNALEEYKRNFISEVKKHFPDIDERVFNYLNDDEWLALYLGEIRPPGILKLMKEDMEETRRGMEESGFSFVVPKEVFLMGAVGEMLLSLVPFEITIYGAERFVFPEPPQGISVVANSRVFAVDVINGIAKLL